MHVNYNLYVFYIIIIILIYYNVHFINIEIQIEFLVIICSNVQFLLIWDKMFPHAEYRFPHNPHNYTTDILLPLGFTITKIHTI